MFSECTSEGSTARLREYTVAYDYFQVSVVFGGALKKGQFTTLLSFTTIKWRENYTTNLQQTN